MHNKRVWPDFEDRDWIPERDKGQVPAKEDYDDHGGWYPGTGDSERIMPRDQLPPAPPLPRKEK